MFDVKISENFILKKIMDDYIVVPVGSELVDFNALITLNETGAFLWDSMQTDIEKDELVSKLCKEYDVDTATATEDVSEFIDKLVTAGVLKSE